MSDPQEEWKQARDTYGARIGYEVSNLGRVRSRKTGREGRIMKGGEGWTSQIPRRRGVWLMNSFDDNSRRQWVDEMVAEAFLGRRPERGRVVHLNGVVWDDRVENLAYREATPALTTAEPVIDDLVKARAAKDVALVELRKAREALQRAEEDTIRAVEVWAALEARGESQTGVQSVEGGIEE